LIFEDAFDENKEIIETYGKSFGSVTSKHLPRKHFGETQWMNIAFYNTCVKWAEGNPFLWLDVTSAPLDGRWLDLIEMEYNTYRATNPYLGVLIENKVAVQEINEQGERIDLVVTKGSRMHRVGVYPENLYERKELDAIFNTLPDLEEPFDYKFSAAISGLTRVSQYIQCNNGSQDYRIEDGVLVCNKVGQYGINDPLKENVVLLTGCVDDSVFEATKGIKVHVNTPFTFKDKDGKAIEENSSDDKAVIEKLLKKIEELENKLSNVGHVIKPIEDGIAVEDGTGRVKRGRKPKEITNV
jgi:hypothetical protein